MSVKKDKNITFSCKPNELIAVAVNDIAQQYGINQNAALRVLYLNMKNEIENLKALIGATTIPIKQQAQSCDSVITRAGSSKEKAPISNNTTSNENEIIPEIITQSVDNETNKDSQENAPISQKGALGKKLLNKFG